MVEAVGQVAIALQCLTKQVVVVLVLKEPYPVPLAVTQLQSVLAAMAVVLQSKVAMEPIQFLGLLRVQAVAAELIMAKQVLLVVRAAEVHQVAVLVVLELQIKVLQVALLVAVVMEQEAVEAQVKLVLALLDQTQVLLAVMD